MTTLLKHLEINYPEIYKRLEFFWLSQNSNIRIKDVLEHPDEPWEWIRLSENPGIQLQDIINHPELPWKWKWVSRNPNMTIEFAIEYKEKLAWDVVTSNAGIKFKDIMRHQELPWVKANITWNPNITINDILNHPEIEWSGPICDNKNMTLDFVLNYLGVDKIDWAALSSNPAITLNDIITHPEYPWVWSYISENPNMTIDFAIEYKEKLDWGEISSNPSITMDDIINHPELPWDRVDVSLNPNITLDFVMENFQHIDFEFLSTTPFKIDHKIIDIQQSYNIAATFAELDDNIIHILIKNTNPELTDKEINTIIHNVREFKTGTPLFVTDMLDVVSKTIAPFNIQNYTWENELGQGTYGIVSKMQSNTGAIAFKQIIKNISKDLIREIGSYAILTAIGSQNTPKLVGFNLESVNMGFAIELATTDLYTWIKQNPSDKSIYYPKIVDWLLVSLNEIQACGIINGDIKLQNMLLWLDSDGNPTKAAITDFGLATSVPEPDLYSEYYRSPEILEHHNSSFASDCWAFAASIFYMCNADGKHHTFEFKNHQIFKYLREDQSTLLNRMLSKSPKYRCLKRWTIKQPVRIWEPSSRHLMIFNKFIKKAGKIDLSNSTLVTAIDLTFRVGPVESLELYGICCLYIANLWCEEYLIPLSVITTVPEKRCNKVIIDILKRVNGLIYIPGLEKMKHQFDIHRPKPKNTVSLIEYLQTVNFINFLN